MYNFMNINGHPNSGLKFKKIKNFKNFEIFFSKKTQKILKKKMKSAFLCPKSKVPNRFAISLTVFELSRKTMLRDLEFFKQASTSGFEWLPANHSKTKS